LAAGGHAPKPKRNRKAETDDTVSAFLFLYPFGPCGPKFGEDVYSALAVAHLPLQPSSHLPSLHLAMSLQVQASFLSQAVESFLAQQESPFAQASVPCVAAASVVVAWSADALLALLPEQDITANENIIAAAAINTLVFILLNCFKH
jgi:hypothetical protein